MMTYVKWDPGAPGGISHASGPAACEESGDRDPGAWVLLVFDLDYGHAVIGRLSL